MSVREGRIGFSVTELLIKCYTSVVGLFLTGPRKKRYNEEVLFDTDLLRRERDGISDRRKCVLKGKAVEKFKACPKSRE